MLRFGSDGHETRGATPGTYVPGSPAYTEGSIDSADVALEVIGFGACHRGGMVGRSATDFENLQAPSRTERRFGQHILEHRALDVAGATARGENSIVSQCLDGQPVETVISAKRLGDSARVPRQLRRIENDDVESLACFAHFFEGLEGIRLLEADRLGQTIAFGVRPGHRERRFRDVNGQYFPGRAMPGGVQREAGGVAAQIKHASAANVAGRGQTVVALVEKEPRL